MQEKLQEKFKYIIRRNIKNVTKIAGKIKKQAQNPTRIQRKNQKT